MSCGHGELGVKRTETRNEIPEKIERKKEKAKQKKRKIIELIEKRENGEWQMQIVKITSDRDREKKERARETEREREKKNVNGNRDDGFVIEQMAIGVCLRACETVKAWRKAAPAAIDQQPKNELKFLEWPCGAIINGLISIREHRNIVCCALLHSELLWIPTTTTTTAATATITVTATAPSTTTTTTTKREKNPLLLRSEFFFSSWFCVALCSAVNRNTITRIHTLIESSSTRHKCVLCTDEREREKKKKKTKGKLKSEPPKEKERNKEKKIRLSSSADEIFFPKIKTQKQISCTVSVNEKVNKIKILIDWSGSGCCYPTSVPPTKK